MFAESARTSLGYFRNLSGFALNSFGSSKDEMGHLNHKVGDADY